MILGEIPRTVITFILLVLNITIAALVIYLACSSNSKPSSGHANHTTEPQTNERIIGGTVTRISHYPFAVGLVASINFEQLVCGGSVIGTYWVVTAGHCAQHFIDHGITPFYFVSGKDKWRQGQKHYISLFRRHNKFDSITLDNDIALVKVKHPFSRTLAKPVALADTNYQYSTNRTATVIGWGKLGSKDTLAAERLYSVQVKIFSTEYCTQLYKEVENKFGESFPMTANMFCAGDYKGGKDACQCDSGGPIVDGKILIGLVSWAVECAVATQPGVYTKISNYKQWIRSIEKDLKETIGVQFKS